MISSSLPDRSLHFVSFIQAYCRFFVKKCNGRHRYNLRLVKWLTLENSKKTAVSQDWWHKKKKPSYQIMVSYQKIKILSKLKQY